MQEYMVQEICLYKVQAESEEAAVNLITDTERRNKFFAGCLDRWAWEEDPQRISLIPFIDIKTGKPLLYVRPKR